jgi:hypothetical protein
LHLFSFPMHFNFLILPPPFLDNIFHLFRDINSFPGHSLLFPFMQLLTINLALSQVNLELWPVAVPGCVRTDLQLICAAYFLLCSRNSPAQYPVNMTFFLFRRESCTVYLSYT